jgi:hypothetical protein
MLLILLTSRMIEALLLLRIFGPWWRVMAQNEQLPAQPRTMVTESLIIS